MVGLHIKLAFYMNRSNCLQVSVMAIEVAEYLVAGVGVYEGVARPEL